jgi:hypothetical protein
VELRRSELDCDALFTHIAEERKKIGDSEEFADLLAEIDELEAGASGFCRCVEADKSAESHAVDGGEVSEIENDALVIGNERMDSGVEVIADAGVEAAVAVDESRGAFALDVESEGLRSRCVGHRFLSLKGNQRGRRVADDCLIETEIREQRSENKGARELGSERSWRG